MLERWFWNLYAISYDALNVLTPYQEMMARVISAGNIADNQKILDAACGTGNLTARLRNAHKDPEITAVDFSEIMLARARKKVPEANVAFKKEDLNTMLSFDDGVFDRVFCINALYNVRDPAMTLREFYRVLRKDGMLIVVTPKEGNCPMLVMKAHGYPGEPDNEWITKSAPKRIYLTFKTFGFSVTAFQFIFVALVNRKIENTMRSFSRDALNRAVRSSGFTIVHSELVYADQCILMVAKKL